MRGARSGEHGRSRRDALLGDAVVHVGRCQQAEARVMVLAASRPDHTVLQSAPMRENTARTK
jgi:hypothetical protein